MTVVLHMFVYKCTIFIYSFFRQLFVRIEMPRVSLKCALYSAHVFLRDLVSLRRSRRHVQLAPREHRLQSFEILFRASRNNKAYVLRKTTAVNAEENNFPSA